MGAGAGKLLAVSDEGGGLVSFPVIVIASPSFAGKSGRPAAMIGSPPVCVGGVLPVMARGAPAAGADDGADEAWGCCNWTPVGGADADAPVAEASWFPAPTTHPLTLFAGD